MSWTVDNTDEFEKWFKELDSESKEAIFSKVILLEAFGPQLGRPHADTLAESKISNLKELRAKTEKHVLRVAFCFDRKRKGWLLIGGDKKGVNEKKFYKDLIKDAEKIIMNEHIQL